MPSDTPDSPDAGEVFSAASACKPPEAEYLPSPLGGRPPHVPSDDTPTSFAPAPATTSMSPPTAVAGFTSVMPLLRSLSSRPRRLNVSISSRRKVWRER